MQIAWTENLHNLGSQTMIFIMHSLRYACAHANDGLNR